MCDAFGARTVITRISILHLDVDRGQNGKGGPTRTRTDDTALLIHLVTGTPSFTSPYAVASLTRSCDVINGDVWPTCRWRDFFFVVPFCACAAHHWSIQVMHTITLTQTGQHQLTICRNKDREKRERPNATSNASQSPSTKRPMLKKLVSSRCLHTDANTCQGHCRKMHTTLMTKHGELNWLATPSMFQLLALGSLIDTSNAVKGQSSKDLNRLGRQAHVEASDKQHQPVLLALVYVSFAGAWWAKRKDFVSQCGYLCAGTEKPLMKGSAAPCCPMSWLHAHMVPLRHKPPRKRRKGPNSSAFCG